MNFVLKALALKYGQKIALSMYEKYKNSKSAGQYPRPRNYNDR